MREETHMYAFKFRYEDWHTGEMRTKWVDVTTSNPNGIAECEHCLATNFWYFNDSSVTIHDLVEWYEYKYEWRGSCLREVRV